ncbi:hypothetical protein LTR70_004837 [Exophiala xenobiotica]|uniref:Uncharacterized protein n=1 Tax=Lithohypha guttulata TaxID=1690604 RepID=A0ABR0KDA8_9EURO|nr:hypothetical protein LTR24_004455 [Lithohypha guttulata]KAK5319793.1 hypothetical protein LTR70_004837 [Exophiala xenobiotica]
MVSGGLIIAGEVTGFISFILTILTWLGVYVSLLVTLRSAPTQIPLVLGNLRQELMEERSMLRQRLKEGDRYHVFGGRQMRRVGKSQSHIRLIENTLRIQWREFRQLERKFRVSGSGGGGGERDVEGAEDVRSDDDEGSGDSDFDMGGGIYGEKGVGGGRARDRARMRRRESHLTDWMGMKQAGLSIDRCTYYRTDLRHRILWWWNQDSVSAIASRVQRLQIRRIERDVYESDELIKRGLAILGGMGGEDVYNDCGEGGPRGPGGIYGGSGVRRRRRSHRAKSSRAPSFSTNSRSRNASRAGVREVYEKETRRVRMRQSSPSTRSSSHSLASPAKVAGSTVSMSRRGESGGRSRGPSVVEYEVVNPGRIWVDVEQPPSIVERDSTVNRRMSRPEPAHYPSYRRQRASERSPSRSRRDR